MFIPVIPINRQKRERRTMSKTVFVKAEELAEDLEISKAMAYKLIHQWNEDLRNKKKKTRYKRNIQTVKSSIDGPVYVTV